MEKTSVTQAEFEKGLQMSPPMNLSKAKNFKTKDDYYKEFGEKVYESLENGTSPLLPNKDGFVDLRPAYNLASNTRYASSQAGQAITQVLLLEKKAELNSKSSAFVTFDTVHNAQIAFAKNLGIIATSANIETDKDAAKVFVDWIKNGADKNVPLIPKGTKGVTIPYEVMDKATGEKKFKTYTYFNLEQITNGDKLAEYLNQKTVERAKDNQVYLINDNKTNNKIIPLSNQTKAPTEYLAQVFNAMFRGEKLQVTPEQAELFKKQTMETLKAEYMPGQVDRFAIDKLCKASYKIFETNRNKNQTVKKDVKVEQKRNFERKSPKMDYDRSR